MPDDFGALLRDGIDLHVHGQPDVSRRFANRGADIEVARLAHAYGLRGWVLKSHLWPTMDRAGMIRDALSGTDFEVYGSITLNPPAGGVSVTVVELAAIGPRQAVLTTDIFSRWVPPEPECLRMFTEQLSYLAIPADDIRQMLVANPRRFLGLPESPR